MIKLILSGSILLNLLLITALTYQSLDQGVSLTYRLDGLSHQIETELNEILDKDKLSRKHFLKDKTNLLQVNFKDDHLVSIGVDTSKGP